MHINDLNIGVSLIDGNDPWIVLETAHTKKGRGQATLKCRLRNLRTGQVKHKTFNQGDTIQEADVDKTTAQFLYRDADTLTFMDQQSYEQYTLSNDVAGPAARFLKEGMDVTLILFNASVIAVQQPIKIELTVTNAPPGVKGDSATNVMKDIIVEGDITIRAPLFIKEGDTIRIDTRTGTYIERVGE